MSGTDRSTEVEELRVVVELRADIAERGAEPVRDAVHLAVEEIIAALGLPAEPVVTVEDSSQGAEGDLCRLHIGDGPYAYVAAVESGADADLEHVAEAAAATLAVNRKLLLTQPIAARLVEAWQEQSPLVANSGVSPDTLARVLADLVHRCINVAPRELDARPHALRHKPRIDTFDGLREAILDARNDASLTVFVEPELLAAPPEGSAAGADYNLAAIGPSLQEVFVDELGVILPTVTFSGDAGLADGQFRIRVNDLTFPPILGLRSGEVLVTARKEDVADRGLAVRSGINPATGGEAAIAVADDQARAALTADGFFVVHPRAYVVFATRWAMRHIAGSLLLSDVLAFALNRLRTDEEAVVDAALARFDRYLLTAVFRRLLDEQIPIRNPVGVLEGMLAIGSGMSIDQSTYDVFAPDTASIWSVADGAGLAIPEAADYAECVRRHLRWHVTRELVDGSGRVQAFMIDRRLESRLRKSEPLDEDERSRLRNAVWSVYSPFARAGTDVVAVTNSEVRHELRRLLEFEFPELRVVSRHEIAPEAEIRWNGDIAWA